MKHPLYPEDRAEFDATREILDHVERLRARLASKELPTGVLEDLARDLAFIKERIDFLDVLIAEQEGVEETLSILNQHYTDNHVEEEDNDYTD